MPELKIILFGLVIFVLSLAPRVYLLGKDFHSIDSDRWFRRAVSFQENLLKGDFAGTYQKQHPGVTTMWLGGLSYKALNIAYPRITGENLDENIPNDFVIINFFLKLPQVIAVVLTIFLLGFIIYKFISKKIALIFLGIVLIDPFLSFYTRQFHVDALMSVFSFAGVLLAYIYSKDGNLIKHPRLIIIASAFFCSLAFLSKSPSAVFAISCGAGIFFYDFFYRKKIKSALISGLIFFLSFVFFYIVLFPANWVNPIHVTAQIIHDSFVNSNEKSSVYVLGHGDDKFGPKFYILVFLFRFSLFVILGTLFLVIQNIFIFVKTFDQKKFLVNGETLIKLIPFTGYVLLAILLIEDTKIYERYTLPFVFPLSFFIAVNICKYLKPKYTSNKLIITSFFSLLLFFGFHQMFVIAPNFIIYPNIFATRDFQLKLFSELGGCESMLYNIATDINTLENNKKDHRIGISGTYMICLKGFSTGQVEDMAENIRRKKPLSEFPDYLVLYKTDNKWLESPYYMGAYNKINTYYISNTPVYYLLKKKLVNQ